MRVHFPASDQEAFYSICRHNLDIELNSWLAQVVTALQTKLVPHPRFRFTYASQLRAVISAEKAHLVQL